MNRFLGRTIASALLLLATALTAAIALFLISVTLLGPKPVVEALRCELNMSRQCLRNDLRHEKQKLREEKRRLELERRKRLEEERRRAALEDRVAELKTIEQEAKKLRAVRDRLNEIGHAASSFVIFHQNNKGRFSVETGHKYASLLKPDQLIKGWCNMYPASRNGISRHVTIAGFDRNKRVKPTSVSRSARNALGFSERDIEAARKRCIWPKGVS